MTHSMVYDIIPMIEEEEISAGEGEEEEEEQNYLFTLTAGNGTEHIIERDAITTNGIYHPFPVPLDQKIEKAGTSINGRFVWLIMSGHLYLLTITKTTAYVERIGNPTTVFIDAAFNVQETILITVTLSNFIVLFQTFPACHLISYVFEAPVPPVSLSYHQLMNRTVVTFTDGVQLLFALPTLFSTESGSIPIPIQPLEPPPDLSEILPEAPPCDECEEESHEMWFGSTESGVPSPAEIMRNIREGLAHCLERQNSLVDRFHTLLHEMDDMRTKPALLREANARCNRRVHALVTRISAVIANTSREPLLEHLLEQFEQRRDQNEEIWCYDDCINEDQERELAELNLSERVAHIEELLRSLRTRTVRL